MCYEGLLDEYFNIEGGRMKVPKTGGIENTGKQFETVSLSSRDDTIIEGIRATHFTVVSQEIKCENHWLAWSFTSFVLSLSLCLAYLAKQNVLQNDFRDRMQDASIADLKDLVSKDVKGHLTAKKLLTRHLDSFTNIYEKKRASDFLIQLEMETNMLHSKDFDEIVSYIHTMICRCEPDKYRPLQLLCLLSTVNNGLMQEYYELLCRSFLQAYGHENIPLLYKLEQLKLFHVKRQSDIPLVVNSNTPAGFRGEGLLKMGKQVAQNLADKSQNQKTFFQFMRKRLNLAPNLNQQMKTTPGPDMVSSSVDRSLCSESVCLLL